MKNIKTFFIIKLLCIVKKIFYFIVALLLLGIWSCINKNSKSIELDENALLEKEVDDYYNSLPDTIIVNTPNGYKKAEKCSGDKYVVHFNNARYWYNKNREIIDSFIIHGPEVRQEKEALDR